MSLKLFWSEFHMFPLHVQDDFADEESFLSKLRVNPAKLHVSSPVAVRAFHTLAFSVVLPN